MKKMMMTLAAVLCCAMTMTVFTACGSDDDDSKNPAEDTTPKQVAMKVRPMLTQAVVTALVQKLPSASMPEPSTTPTPSRSMPMAI